MPSVAPIWLLFWLGSVLFWLAFSFRYWHGSLLLAIVLAWQLSWLRSRLCLGRGMALVLAWVLSSLSFQLRVKLGMALVFTRVIAANDA